MRWLWHESVMGSSRVTTFSNFAVSSCFFKIPFAWFLWIHLRYAYRTLGSCWATVPNRIQCWETYCWVRNAPEDDRRICGRYWKKTFMSRRITRQKCCAQRWVCCVRRFTNITWRTEHTYTSVYEYIKLSWAEIKRLNVARVLRFLMANGTLFNRLQPFWNTCYRMSRLKILLKFLFCITSSMFYLRKKHIRIIKFSKISKLHYSFISNCGLYLQEILSSKVN